MEYSTNSTFKIKNSTLRIIRGYKMATVIDARGLACPGPVLKTKQSIDKESPDDIRIMVDNEAARQNVSRFLQTQGYTVSVRKEGGDLEIRGIREGGASISCSSYAEVHPDQKKIMVMVTTDRIGHGDDELGARLMTAFLKTLKEMGSELWRLVFLNNAVKLTIEGSPVLDTLKDLADTGVTILVCGTCLDHFKLLEQKRVGDTTNMLDIVTSMQLADKVINI
ncbi:conserved hypothetical protein [uncultured Desulfobacterium sp.]|uniref:UPF0033 domain-containing protein n=1 Tax=uncultured Desulfobacterium sp. TaxID=201089 RepID=A0A445MUA0_9BACT|nr:conserved hypothetical protein [uncultured Desulfobacterium sp.]